jgi:hypothetical protein
MPHRAVCALLLLLIPAVPTAALATEVLPGIDPVEHLPPSGWDFAPVPLPADFFGPGSDPFDGGIPDDQTSLDPTPDCPGAAAGTSILLARLDVAALPSVPSSDVIDTEIIAMSLVSSSPITVTYNGGLNPEQWNVEITPSPSTPSTGTMTIRLEHSEGGTFDSDILLQPYFTFTRVSDAEVRTLDGAGVYQDLIAATNVPWVYGDPDVTCPSCTSNFVPGHNGLNKVEYSYVGTLSNLSVRSSCIETAIPTLSQWGQLAALLALLAAGAYLIARRRRVSTA